MLPLRVNHSSHDKNDAEGPDHPSDRPADIKPRSSLFTNAQAVIQSANEGSLIDSEQFPTREQVSVPHITRLRTTATLQADGCFGIKYDSVAGVYLTR